MAKQLFRTALALSALLVLLATAMNPAQAADRTKPRLVAAPGPSLSTPQECEISEATSTQRVAVLLVDFDVSPTNTSLFNPLPAGAANQAFDAAYVDDLLTNSWVTERVATTSDCEYIDRFEVTDWLNPYVALEDPSTDCGAIFNAGPDFYALEAAADLDPHERLVLVYSCPGVNALGWQNHALIGGPLTALFDPQPGLDPDILIGLDEPPLTIETKLMHEWGHAFGFRHADQWTCAGGTFTWVNPQCIVGNYNNEFDAVSGGEYSSGTSAWNRHYAGWLTDDEYQEIHTDPEADPSLNGPGVYTLGELNDPDASRRGYLIYGPDGGVRYSVEMRAAVNEDEGLSRDGLLPNTNGLMIYTVRSIGTVGLTIHTELLDLDATVYPKPGEGPHLDRNHVALQPGTVFDDGDGVVIELGYIVTGTDGSRLAHFSVNPECPAAAAPTPNGPALPVPQQLACY